MKKFGTWKSVVIWSVISAAFIGPGTVTTAVSAGSSFRLELLWAVAIATLACIVLQEVAARITIASGMNIGEALIIRYGTKRGKQLQWLIGGIVVAGCVAYEAGNILGAVAGLHLLSGLDPTWITIGIAAGAFVLLWKGRSNWISNLMMILIVIMGIAFLRVAWLQDFNVEEVLQAAITPRIPPGGELLLLGLVGTTIVPYNLFLASGISKGQSIPMMRAGLAISVVLGGLITGAILVAGTAVQHFSSFSDLYAEFNTRVGGGSAWALAIGLFAAGFSSTITAPYAASVITSTVYNLNDALILRVVRIAVLIIGFGVAVIGLKPIQVILVVQALNGLILPLLVIFLILLVNDRAIIPASFRHSRLYNLLLLIVLGAVSLISLSNVDKAIISGLNLNSSGHLVIVSAIASLIIIVVGWLAWRMEKSQN